jgi:hypothetical protein
MVHAINVTAAAAVIAAVAAASAVAAPANWNTQGIAC